MSFPDRLRLGTGLTGLGEPVSVTVNVVRASENTFSTWSSNRKASKSSSTHKNMVQELT